MTARTSIARVARLPYLNTAPFFTRWDALPRESGGLWRPAVFPPRQLGLACEAGEVDAGPMALADLLRLGDTFEPLPVPGEDGGYGIANHGRVDSVLLFVRRAITGSDGGLDLSQEQLLRLGGRQIGVTGETSTSFRLLRLLLEVRGGVRPAAYQRLDLQGAPLDAIDAALVIGDLALRFRRRPPEGFTQGMDLAAAWGNWTGLPFVFARWGVRRSLDPEAKLWLGRFLRASLEDGLARLEELARASSDELGEIEERVRYLRGFTYRLGPKELEAAERYHALLTEHDLLRDPARPFWESASR